MEDPSITLKEIKAGLGSANPSLNPATDFSNPLESNLDIYIPDQTIKSKKDRMEEFKNSRDIVQETERRKWMERHGRGKFVQFNDEYRKKIREAFDSLDSKQIGSIGRPQMEDSLIGLGLVDTPQEVDEIIRAVDSDGSGSIEFKEFFDVLKSRDNPGKSLMIFDYFTKFKSDAKDPKNKGLPFSLYVSQQRREKLMSAIFSNDPEGLKRMEAFKKLLEYREKQKSADEKKEG